MITPAEILDATILVVDDLPANVLLLTRMLHNAGYNRVTSTVEPGQVCDLHRKNRYDLILLDLQMPVMDGFQVMEELKRIDPEDYLSVLVVTAQPDHRLRALKAGARDFISKPFDLAEVLMRVHNLLEVRLLQRKTRRLYDEVVAEQRISAQRLMVFRSGPVVVSINSVSGGKILDANEEHCRFFGYTHEELADGSVSDADLWANPDDRVAVTNRLLCEGAIRGFEIKQRRRSGEVRVVLASLELLALAGEQGPLLISMFTDITERKQAELALSESEERYRDILENANDLILSVSPEGKLLYANHAWHRTLGYGEEELPQLRLLDLIPPEGREQPSKLFSDAAEGKNVPLVEAEFVSKANKRIIVEGSVSAKFENGRIVSLRCIFRDVTEKKDSEAQILRNQRMESIGTIAGGIAHDLNNMLTPILLAIEILRKSIADEGALKLLDLLRKSALHGADMVRQVLTFSRGGDGRKIPVSTKQLVEEVVGIMEHTFPKSIAIRAETASDVWTVVGDDTQLHQVLLNLCVNARDAMPSGGTLTIHAENCTLDVGFVRKFNPAAEPGQFVLIGIADTGTGIPPQVLERIFEPFFTTKALTKGTGLGLATVQGIVRGHHGFISVESVEGRGSAFNVYVPATSSHQSGKSALPLPDHPLGAGEVILVLDDDEVIQHVTRRALEEFGYQVLVASGVGEAINLCAENKGKIRVLIADTPSPALKGSTTIGTIREIDPSIRIIDVSGIRLETIPVEAEADAYLPKPYDSNSLLRTVSELLAPVDPGKRNPSMCQEVA